MRGFVYLRRVALLIVAVAWHLCLMAESDFVRMERIADLTENAEYIIGAMNHNPNYPAVGFQLMAYSQTAIAYGEVVPERLDAACGAAIWRLVYEADRIVLQRDDDSFALIPNSGNALRYSTIDYTLWTVAVAADGEFLLSHEGKLLRMNPKVTSASLFGAYGASQYGNGVIIYKREIAPERMTSYQRFVRGGAKECETLCLPFAAEVPSGVKAFSVVDRRGEELSYAEVQRIEPGVAYVLRADAPKLLTFRSIDAANGSNRRRAHVATPGTDAVLQGTFSSKRINSGLVLNGSAFVPAAADALLPAFRAYIAE